MKTYWKDLPEGKDACDLDLKEGPGSSGWRSGTWKHILNMGNSTCQGREKLMSLMYVRT